jgi:quinone-modifying oxidoreductase subunit QmoB
LEKKTGIYICSGCEIGTAIDTSALMDKMNVELKPEICRVDKALCSAQCLSAINDDIKKNQLSAVIIAACTKRVNTDLFDFGEDIICERVNLREQVAWCTEPNTEDTQMLGEDYLRMAVARVENIHIPKPFIPDELSSTVLVVGGGVTGISAAIEGAEAGYKIILVEKEEKVGGWLSKLYRQCPTKPPYTNLQQPEINELVTKLELHNNIEVLCSSSIEKISGQPGKFQAVINANGKTKDYTVGSVVSALGWNPYDPTKLTDYKYSENQNIITNVELEQQAAMNQIKRPSDNKVPKSVLFVQCAGSRDEKHLSYCSNYCCLTSLKQAKYIRDLLPDTNVYIVFKDIRTPGNYEEFYKEIQQDDRIFLTKGEIKSISGTEEKIQVEVDNSLIGTEISIEVDMVVLATGMTPANSDQLNLAYRLGKGLPTLKYEFTDSHFICFPYETRRTGIYAAGTARAPMDITSSKEDAAGAMLKAIQCIEATKRGEAVHPRSGDKSYPSLYLERCTDCKRCTEECPFGTYDENEKGTPLPNPGRCRRCGICLGSCPERVISFEDYSINSISSMIKAVHIPDEFEEKPRVLAFVCENDAYPAFDMSGLKRLKISPYIRIIPVRCLGSINKVWISDALSQGFDGVLQIGCKPGDDYQCHFIHGSELTETRGENIQETLTTMMLETERIQTEFVEINDFEKIPSIINDYMEVIEQIGPNPFKDM